VQSQPARPQNPTKAAPVTSSGVKRLVFERLAVVVVVVVGGGGGTCGGGFALVWQAEDWMVLAGVSAAITSSAD